MRRAPLPGPAGRLGALALRHWSRAAPSPTGLPAWPTLCFGRAGRPARCSRSTIHAIERRTWAKRALWLLVVAFLAAAGSGGGGDPEPSTAAPAQPGEVRIGVGEDIWPLTGQGGNARHFAAGELNVGVYEPLLTMGPDFSVRPGLAERWEQVGP